MFSTLIVRVQTPPGSPPGDPGPGGYGGAGSPPVIGGFRGVAPRANTAPHDRGAPGGRPPGLAQIGPAPGGRADQLNPADLWPRASPGPQANLRDHDNLVGLRAAVALRDLELDPLSLFESAIAI